MAVFFVTVVAVGCSEPALDVTGKQCSSADPCPAPFVCAGADGSRGGLCRRQGDGGGSESPAPHVVAAGAVACAPTASDFNAGNGTASGCRMKATAQLIAAVAPAAVLVLGDAQFADGSLEEYQASYELGWGRFLSITHPAVGVHDYFTGSGLGYFSYFGAAAGSPGLGAYSFDVGSWHLISLSSECEQIGGCGAGSAEEQWLRQDLAGTHARCVLAFWSHPRFSSVGNDASTAALWEALYQLGADVVLNGGGRFYERTTALAPDGGADLARGLRQFDVGTGGIGGFTGFDTISPTTDAAQTGSFGVLDLTLRDGGYDFAFRAVPPDTYQDHGSFDCH